MISRIKKGVEVRQGKLWGNGFSIHDMPPALSHYARNIADFSVKASNATLASG